MNGKRLELLKETLPNLSRVGVLWNPERGPWRFGMTYSSTIRSDQVLDTSGGTPVTVNGLIIPQQVILPASLGLGASYAVDSAPFWPGHKWLVASDLLFTASSTNAVGVESVLAQKIQLVGTDDTVGVRLGSELETIPGRLRLRLGTYYEPSNYQEVTWSLADRNGGTELTVGETNLPSDEAKATSEQGWDAALGELKRLLEEERPS